MLPRPPIVGSYNIPAPGKPALQDNLNSMWIVLQVAGLASLALSGFLVTNVMTALIAQQIRQIGILKAIGARRQQIISVYLVMAMILGGVSLIIALPLGTLAAYGVIHFIARILNTEITNFYLPWETAVLQTTVSLLVPAVATIVPAIVGTNMVAREAMFSTGSGNTSNGLINRTVEPLSSLSTTITLAVRNVFRQRIRLILTLLALSLGAGIFIAVLGVRTALDANFASLSSENNFNIQVRYRLDKNLVSRDVEREVLAIPGVIRAETWKITTMRRVFEDGSTSGSISIVAVPPNSEMLRIAPVRGRWLDNEGMHQLFVNSDAIDALGLNAQSPQLLSSQNEAHPQQAAGYRSLNTQFRSKLRGIRPTLD
jgi:putative ABC transport system permease protein